MDKGQFKAWLMTSRRDKVQNGVLKNVSGETNVCVDHNLKKKLLQKFCFSKLAGYNHLSKEIVRSAGSEKRTDAICLSSGPSCRQP